MIILQKLYKDIESQGFVVIKDFNEKKDYSNNNYCYIDINEISTNLQIIKGTICFAGPLEKFTTLKGTENLTLIDEIKSEVYVNYVYTRDFMFKIDYNDLRQHATKIDKILTETQGT